MNAPLPEGIRVGNVTDNDGWTGCTVILCPEGSTAAAEVRGGGPGTRESDLLTPAASVPGVHAILLTGGSAYGLAAADGVVAYLEERGIGVATRSGIVPLVAAAVVYDLALGDAARRPRVDDGYAAASAASDGDVERGNIGAGTGCTIAKLIGPAGWSKGGLGYAGRVVGGGHVAALAVVNAFGDVIAEDGSLLAGVWSDSERRYRRTVDLLAEGVSPVRPWREATTLTCVITDARLTKTQAWLVARAAGAGVCRTVDPAGTPVDGDATYCVATGRVDLDPFVVAVVAADVTAAAVRDAVRSAVAAPGCPSAADRS